MNYKNLITIIADKTAAEWDALETEEALTAVFGKNYTDTTAERPAFESEYNADAALTDYYADDEFETVAASIDTAAESLVTILEDVLDNLPEPADDILRRIDYVINYLEPNTPCGAYLYAYLLLAMLADFPDRLETGLGIPEARAARRAYGRFLNFKEGNTGNTGVVIPDPDDDNGGDDTEGGGNDNTEPTEGE